jgi:hypothetical protein
MRPARRSLHRAACTAASTKKFSAKVSLPRYKIDIVELVPRSNFVDRPMEEKNRDFQIVSSDQSGPKKQSLAKPDPGATPFKIVIDPKVRMDLRRALIDLIDYHDDALADHFAEGNLALESYKEYIELFARSLKETMDSREGVSYLLRSVGFEVDAGDINLNPELRWKKGPRPFGPSLL